MLERHAQFREPQFAPHVANGCDYQGVRIQKKSGVETVVVDLCLVMPRPKVILGRLQFHDFTIETIKAPVTMVAENAYRAPVAEVSQCANAHQGQMAIHLAERDVDDPDASTSLDTQGRAHPKTDCMPARIINRPGIC